MSVYYNSLRKRYVSVSMNASSVSKETIMEDKRIKLYRASEVFKPSAPINTRDLFSGRIEQMRTVLNSIGQTGQHVIIYGERGVGKTSLANVIPVFLPTDIVGGVVTVKVNCDVDMSYRSLFEAILDEIKLEFKKPGMGFNAEIVTEVKTLSDYVKENKEINPNELRFLFRALQNKIIIIIDEFDRIKDSEVKRLLADTIKNFSDYSVDTTFVLVGVADSVESLISEHESIERALVQVKMPRMSISELEEIVNRGLKILKLKIRKEARHKIVQLSQGLPHYTHLLSLYAAQAAIMRDALTIDPADVIAAVDEAIEKSQESVKARYYKAVNSTKSNLYPQILLSCAMVSKNEMGFFSATDIKEPLLLVTGKVYDTSAFAKHLKEFCEVKRGPVIQKVGTLHRYQYRFTNPLMEPYIIMNGLSKKLIEDKHLS
jgi:Holliday junction resolvasome RuvABC ATP-dependent DNA helicase subunit